MAFVERKNRTIKNSLEEVLDSNLTDWPYVTEGVLFAHRFIKEPKRQWFKKKFNKLLLKPHIVSDTDHIYNGNVNITEDEKVVEEDINIFKPMEFGKSCF